MNLKYIAAVGGIFLLACMGWMVLGTSTSQRSDQQQHYLHHQVAKLWGSTIVQQAPQISHLDHDGHKLIRGPDASDVSVDLALKHRRKGLLWYPTYSSDFVAVYTVRHHGLAQFNFSLPDPDATYDYFNLQVNGEEQDILNPTSGIHLSLANAPFILVEPRSSR